jgi:UDP-3-O-[3-hydroxymyristoyl] N-acetylglucosamine deacetylase / 3-hydroxyacyl-[acyl-carrier-protein] dehydratase
MSEDNSFQYTLGRSVTLSGIGLHTGQTSTITFHPAESNSGVTIKRSDLPNAPIIHPRADRVSQTLRGTTLKENGVEVHTIEHVLAALAGLEIDNCCVEVTASEPPIMDGSAAPFVTALQSVPRITQNSERKVFHISEIIRVGDGDKEIVVYPDKLFRITFHLEFRDTWIPSEQLTIIIHRENFIRTIANNRTFCFEHEVEWLKKQGLAQGGNAGNALVIGDTDFINGPLRQPQELVYHKILDLVGDMSLIGAPVCAHIVARKSGHALNTQLAQGLQKRWERELEIQRRNCRVIINTQEIMEFLPHRYPFLLVDRIIELEDRKRVVGIKNVTINEPFFQGHFPGHPIMPGVLIVEAMAQCGGVLLMKTVPDAKSKVVYFVKLDNVKFRKPVLPGDQLRFELEVVKLKERLAQMQGKAFVGEDLVCEAELMSTLVDR